MSFKDNLKTFAGNLPSLFGNGAIGAAFNMAASAYNSRLAEQASQREYNRQLDFWQKQNEYNTPLNQRMRLEEAGFNPAAAINGIAGNNTAGQLSSVPANEVDKRGRVDLNALNNSIALLGQMESVGANTDLLRRQVELAAMQHIIMNHQAYGIDIDNKTKLEYLQRIGQKEDLTLEKMLAEIENINKDTDKKEAEIGHITIQTAVGESTIELNNAQKQYTEALTKTVNATRQYDIELKQASAEQLRSSASLAREQCNKTREEAHALKDEDRIRTWNIAIGEFFHMGDISVLPSELQTKAAEYYWDFQTGEKSLESTVDAFYKQVNRYIEKNGHIVTTVSESKSHSYKTQLLSQSDSNSRTITR